ncbi:hypothetical protein [Lutibacter sp.]|uniref:hypothetical protein n=1 Tax=Lutibacter sp. TaxID=1925666 RepID=UPI002734D87B|nr:hypothetical protein [Lutibacter sp.]MDP3312405.1 hypothetical protein [Lutibacter sp.]
MKTEQKPLNQSNISRRGILPILGGSLLIPLIGFGQPVPHSLLNSEEEEEEEEEEYQTLLKPDGTAVRVKKSVVNNAKIIEKNVSNQSFLTWLGRKL